MSEIDGMVRKRIINAKLCLCHHLLDHEENQGNRSCRNVCHSIFAVFFGSGGRAGEMVVFVASKMVLLEWD